MADHERHVEPPSDALLWQLMRAGETAAALLRVVPEGVALRYHWNGMFHSSETFRLTNDLLRATAEKRRELEAKGWGLPT